MDTEFTSNLSLNAVVKFVSLHTHAPERILHHNYSLRSLLIAILAFKFCSQIIVILTFQYTSLFPIQLFHAHFLYIPPFSLLLNPRAQS
jgi:hypothetical protein